MARRSHLRVPLHPHVLILSAGLETRTMQDVHPVASARRANSFAFAPAAREHPRIFPAYLSLVTPLIDPLTRSPEH